MTDPQIRKAIQRLDATRSEYRKAAKKLLATIQPTPSEIEQANKIIQNDYERTGGDFPHDALGYEENVALTILDEVRS